MKVELNAEDGKFFMVFNEGSLDPVITSELLGLLHLAILDVEEGIRLDL